MDTLGYWDTKYIELLRSLCKEFPRDARLYKVIADHILHLEHSGLPAPMIIRDVPPDGYDAQDQAAKNELWEAVSAWFEAAPSTNSEHRGLRYLADRFALDGTRLRIVNFFFLYDRYALFTEFLRESSESKREEFMRRFLDMPRNQLIEELRSSGELLLAGILSDQ